VSLVQSFFWPEMEDLDLPRIARREFGIGAIEFVNHSLRTRP